MLSLQHDFPPECRPGGLHGNYIMFASATSGDRPNNSKFSKCSIGNISNVLDAIEDNKKRNCFTGMCACMRLCVCIVEEASRRIKYAYVDRKVNLISFNSFICSFCWCILWE